MNDRTKALNAVDLAATLLTRTPGWARVGLMVPSARTREAAAAELAQVIVASLEGSTAPIDARRMALPL